MNLNKIIVVTASLFGFSSLILDAIGAHALRHWLSGNAALESIILSWQTAVRSQVIHALFLVLVVSLGDKIGAPWRNASVGCVILGMLLFSGSIYVKTLTSLESATRFAPLGGILLMLGWLFIGLGALLKDSHVP